MKNKFIVTSCRFHTKEKNKLVITGWFQENQQGENKLLVCLDKKKIPFTIDEKEIMSGEKKTREGVYITKQYLLWINLPRSWKECHTLDVKNFYQGVGEDAFSISMARLEKLGKKINKYVEVGEATSDGFQITGWYVNTGNVQMSFRDKSGNNYPVTVSRKRRPDVRRVYPECSEEDIIGFTASYVGKIPSKIQVHFEEGEKSSDYTVIFHQSSVKKYVDTVGAVIEKAKAYYQQFGAKETALRVVEKVTKRDLGNYQAWFKYHSPSLKDLNEQRSKKFTYSPCISIVVPLYNTPKKYLVEMIESVRKQSYENWELCLSDGSGADSSISHILKRYEAKDKRIKVVYNQRALYISENTNEALKIATGDYIAFADHDDLLAPNALYECVCALNDDPQIDILYTDEDKVDMRGKQHFMPHFKPDFNIDMLRSVNYICHLFVVRRTIYQKVGMLNPEFDGAQDYDFVFRCVEESTNIKHIPKILYHWRAHRDSTAENPESKNYAFKAGARAIQAHYERVGILATVYETENKGIYRSKYQLKEKPLVSVIIPNKDHIGDLDKCISSLENKCTYKNLEYIIVENNSTEQSTFDYYRDLEEKNPKAKVVFWEGEGFNYPSINNYGVQKASGEYLLFLNNDTEIINEECIDELVGYCMRDDVGAVGARLYYEDGTIQHAGVIIGLGGIAGHVFPGYEHNELGYFGRIVMAQDYSAVTAACLMTKREVFQQVGGFDEKLAVAFNDVDLCLKIREAGYLIVYNPYAELNHYESKSRGYEDTDKKVKRFNSEVRIFAERWNHILSQGDPYYNSNLTLDRGDFSLIDDGI